jgi:hypothetical protein
VPGDTGIIVHNRRVIANSYKNDCINNTGLYFFSDDLVMKDGKTEKALLELVPKE